MRPAAILGGGIGMALAAAAALAVPQSMSRSIAPEKAVLGTARPRVSPSKLQRLFRGGGKPRYCRDRECARRRRQIAAGSLTEANGLRSER